MLRWMPATAFCGAILMSIALGQVSPASERFDALFGSPAGSFPAPASPEIESHPRWMEPGMQWIILRELFVDRLETKSPGATYNQNVRRVLIRFTDYRGLIGRCIRDITQIDLEQYVSRRRKDQWRGKPLSAVTINNEIAILNAIFAWCGPRESRGTGRSNLELLARPPYLDPLPEDDVVPVLLTPERISACLAATRCATTPRIDGCSPRTFWTCALLLDSLTLLRRGALLQIPRPDDVELLELKQIPLPARYNKRRRDEWVSLGTRRDLVELFASLPSLPGEPLLPWVDRRGRRMSLSHFSRSLKAFQIKAGILPEDCVRLKNLRSTSATLVGDQFNDGVAKRKLKQSPASRVFERHYKSRAPTAAEAAATDFLLDRFLSAAGVAGLS